MRVGVSGQTLWAVNEGAQPNRGITHVKSDDLQMRVGVSGQTLWAVNEGA